MGRIIRSDGNKCPICGEKNIEIYSDGEVRSNHYCYICPFCGEYFASEAWSFCYIYEKDGRRVIGNEEYDEEKLKSYLFYHKGEMRPYLVKAEVYAKLVKDDFYKIYNLTPEMVDAWYPKAFAEKIDNILLQFAKKSSFMGEEFKLMAYELLAIYFISYMRTETLESAPPSTILKQIQYINDYLQQEGYVQYRTNPIGATTDWTKTYWFTINPLGWARIEELQKSKIINKNIFVSMAFNEETKDTREAIRQGIIKAKHSPEFLDEIIHNRQIVPEMFRLIRESRFLILEISDPNYGAYYEAGYALGLNKEVIVCCRRDVFERKDYDCDKENGQNKDKDKKCWYMQKALKPHFDILQKQILVWDDYSDLTKKLEEWIRELSTR